VDSSIPRGKPEMFAGLVGHAVETFEPYTEADSTAIAAQFLVSFGNALGRGPCVYVGETRHGLNEFLMVVGRSSRARKGDGKNIALRLLEMAAPDWIPCVSSGLSTAEGLIFHVRDAMVRRDKDGAENVSDAGVTDKRLLAVETEFASVLKHFERQGNTLSQLLRDVWDGKSVLSTLTKSSPLRATGAHVSIIAHTTPADLREHLTTVDVANGLGNRFLVVETDRARLLPHPARVPAAQVSRLAAALRAVLEHGRQVEEMHWTANGAALWERIYPELSRDHPGLAGAMLARAEAHVVRLSALFALLAQAQEIGAEHLTSALALWEVVEASVRRVFADRTGNTTADRIRAGFLPGQRMALTEVRGTIFSNHITDGRLKDAIELLVALGDFRVEEEATKGRPAFILVRRPVDGWHAEPANEHREETEGTTV